MTIKNTFLKRITAIILAFAVLIVTLPTAGMFANAETDNIVFGEKTADISTMDSWRDLFPEDNTNQAGRIWTDKSVFTDASAFSQLVDVDSNDAHITMKDADNNFLVALSALASNKSIVGYSYTPTDTMLVLDASGSMGNSNYVDELVTSANSAIKELLELNYHNRIGVVLYSGNDEFGNSAGNTATVLLPLDRYTQEYTGTEWVEIEKPGPNDWEEVEVTEKNIFLVNDGQSSISVNRGVKDGNGNDVDEDTKNVSGGTYIQNGVYMAMEEFLEVEDTVIPDGQNQAGTTRTPIFVLMSDGLPTAATTNFAGQNNNNNTVGLGTSNLGDGGTVEDDVLADAIDFVNQLTAAYATAKVDAKYADTEPLFYTLGLGAGNNLNSAVLNPSAYSNTDELWEDYVAVSNNSSLMVEVEESNRNPDTVSISKVAEITSVDQKDYVTEHFAANNAQGLIDAFDEIVNQIIIQSLYYPTLVESGDHDNDGYVEFIDDIGHYMEVKDIKGITLGNTLFTGERLAANFTPSGGDLINPDGSYSELGDNMVWSVQQRLGIENVQDARDVINSAYNAGQLYYDEETGEWSNYIGWYADDAGNFLGHWEESHTEEDIPVGATYINRSYGMLGEVTSEHTETNMMYISTQVHTRISNGNVSFIWRIPASLVPVVSYNIHLDGETLADAESATIEYTPAEPIRIIFEVGMQDDITPYNVSDKVEDKDEHMLDTDGDGVDEYAFYTNWWNDDNLSHADFSRTEDTIVFFEPSYQNERYYYAEETPIYVKTGTGETDADYKLYDGDMPTKDDGNTYYRRYVVFEGTGATNDNGLVANLVPYYEETSDDTIDAVTAECENANGTWDVPTGTVHRVLEPYNLEKADKTLTATIEYVRYPVVEDIQDNDSFYIGSYLGNNGRLTMEIPQGIKLTKAVDDTLYGTNNTYTFKIETAAEVASYNVDVYTVAADGSYEMNTVSFDGSIEVSTTAGVDVYVIGLKENVQYTVTEVIAGDATYEVASITLDGTALDNTDKAEFTLEQYATAEVGFVNTLKPEPEKGMLVVSKEVIINDPLLEYDSSRVFTFGVYDGDLLVGEKFTLADGQSKTIEDLEAGKTYTVKEENIPAGFKATAEEVSATIVANRISTAHFVNTYDPEPATPGDPDSPKPANIIVNGTKTLSGREWLTTDSFTFTLSQLDGAVWTDITSRTVNSQNKVYTFDFAKDDDINVSFAAAGDYWFRVNEVQPDNAIAGITYDTDYRYFKVVVTDSEIDGYYEIASVVESASTVVTSATASGVTTWTATANVTNTYAPTGNDDLVITIDKTVTDRVGAGTGKQGFTFGLFTAEGTTPIVTSEPTDEGGHTEINLSFPAAYVGRSYEFEIREIVPEDKLEGMTYDPIVYPVTIKIVDNLDGTVKAVIETSDEDVEDITVDFENIYDPADAEVVITGTKVMTGRDFDANEFTFELYEEGNAVPKLATNDSKANGGRFTFETLKFDTVGTYKYTLKERVGSLGGVEYSGKNYAIEITVSDDTDNDGCLNATVKVDGNTVSAANIASALTVTNIYTAEETEVTLEATKELEGRNLENGEFKFDLYSADEDFVKDELLQNDIVNEAGKVAFETITYNTPGDYYYVMLEDEVDGNGVTNDKTEHKIKVAVTDDGEGQLAATVYVNDTEVTGEIADTIVFKNTYSVGSGEIKLGGMKYLAGRDLNEGEFTFNLWFAKLDENRNWVRSELVEQVTNGADGKFAFETREATLGATYVYFITEDATDPDETITYDDTEYMIVVTATDNLDGTVDVNYSYTVNGANAEGVSFSNTYTAPTPDPDEPYIPKTGVENNRMILWLAVLFISGGAFTGLTVYNAKKAKKD